MQNKKIKVIQLGGQSLELEEWLTYSYLGDADLLTAKIGKDDLYKNGKINKKFSSYRFLVPTDSTLLANWDQLKLLPANNIIMDQQVVIPTEYQHLAKLLNVQYLDFSDRQQLAEKLILNFFQGQSGYLFQVSSFQPAYNPEAKLEQRGDNVLIFHHVSTDELRWIGSYTDSFFTLGDQQWEYLPECYVEGEDTELEYRIHVKDPNSDQEEVYIISGDALHETTVLPPLTAAKYISVSVYGRGPGNIYLGHIHVRKSHDGHGFSMIGGESRVLDKRMNQELIFFFDAGDMKPPLNVYFSGFRPAEGFEGYFMMAGFDAPFILVNDPRVIGGDFYVGSPEFEAGVAQYINEKLAELGFTNQQLVLSGVSMGSFAALYYSVDLQPAAVVVGKPLINLGTIAKNSRLNRPNDFDVSLDMLTTWTGGITQDDMRDANKIFMDKFKTGDFSHTEFDIAYMNDDDYDMEAFRDLNVFLRDKYPKIRLLHKGFIGRHNDDTAGIFEWFVKQYKRILMRNFGRKFGKEDK